MLGSSSAAPRTAMRTARHIDSLASLLASVMATAFATVIATVIAAALPACVRGEVEPVPAGGAEPAPAVSAPAWAQAGLSEREAAAHVLSRFTFGARPEDIDALVAIGVDAWLDAQLADPADRALERRLREVEALQLSTEEVAQTYRRGGEILREATARGWIDDPGALQGPERREAIRRAAERLGWREESALFADLLEQRMVRAASAEAQLAETLANFWFHHFNVSLTDTLVRPFVLDYEQTLRAHALGDFRTLLGEVASHPAMLVYLDNARSLSVPDDMRIPRRMGAAVNENFARELMELHTLGVDGGYTEEDVREVARVFSGWSVEPVLPGSERIRRRLGRLEGNEQDGLFVFYAALHDSGAKQALGVSFPGGEGRAEGERVLDLLAAHPATAQTIAHKFAVRFVQDEPPAELVSSLAAAYLDSGGETAALVRAAVHHPAFWSAEARLSKVKTPFELLASLYRLLDCEIRDVRATARALEMLGQPFFAYAPPTGRPDHAEAWTSGGAIVMRMNVGIAAALGRLEGVEANAELVPPLSVEGLHAFAERMLPAHSASDRAALVEELVALTEPIPRERRNGGLGSVDLPEGAHTLRTVEWYGALIGSPDFQRR